MANPIDAITAVSNMIDKLADLLAKWMAGVEPRRMRRAIEYGERYIRLISPHIDKIGDKKIIKEAKEIEADFFKNN